MTQVLLSIFLVMPFAYEDYMQLRIEAEIEGVSLEHYLADYIAKLTNSKDVIVEIETESDIEAHCTRADCSQ